MESRGLRQVQMEKTHWGDSSLFKAIVPKKKENEEVLTCHICLKDHHTSCHEPAITSKPSGVCICTDCDTHSDRKRKKKRGKERSFKKFKSHHSGNEYEASTVALRDEFSISIEQYPTSVPSVKKWSIENVEFFLKFLGFENEAPAFREKEIDGVSLLQLKRNDVLTGFGIKLGPALKIYKHIVKLQSRNDDN